MSRKRLNHVQAKLLEKVLERLDGTCSMSMITCPMFLGDGRKETAGQWGCSTCTTLICQELAGAEMEYDCPCQCVGRSYFSFEELEAHCRKLIKEARKP